MVDAEQPPEWMVRLANEAVEQNLINGHEKYKSAQGYACALTAIELMYNRDITKESHPLNNDTV